MKIKTEKEAFPVIVAFIRSLSLSVAEGSISEPTFLPGITIRQGVLVYDPSMVFYPGDLLHEAGHLAVLHPEKRAALTGNLSDMFPEEEGGEMAVILWTWLVCEYLGMEPEIVFHPNGYKEDSEWLCNEFRKGRYIGLPLLEWMGMVQKDESGNLKVLRWLRE